MTTLERFLVKKPVSKPLEELAAEESQVKGPNRQLASTISELKGIFPHESEENLMLLALQNQNPRDLEVAVHRMLETGKSFEVVKQEWNTVKNRDKKKPEQTKGYGRKKYNRTVEETNEEIPGYSRGKPNQKYSKSYKRPENDYKNPRRVEASNPDSSKFVDPSTETQKSLEEQGKEEVQVFEPVQEKPLEEPVLEVKPKFEGFPSLVTQPWDRTQSPPQEISDLRSSHPPASIIVEEENKLPMEMSKKILSPAHSEHIWKESRSAAKKPETKDFGVQVEMEYGIPIIVYPYMFQRS